MLLKIIKKGRKGTDMEILVKTIYPFLSPIYLILVKTIIQFHPYSYLLPQVDFNHDLASFLL